MPTHAGCMGKIIYDIKTAWGFSKTICKISVLCVDCNRHNQKQAHQNRIKPWHEFIYLLSYLWIHQSSEHYPKISEIIRLVRDDSWITVSIAAKYWGSSGIVKANVALFFPTLFLLYGNPRADCLVRGKGSCQRLLLNHPIWSV